MKALSVLIVLFLTVGRFSWAGNGQSTQETPKAAAPAKPSNSETSQPTLQNTSQQTTGGQQQGQVPTSQAGGSGLRAQQPNGGQQGQGAAQGAQQANAQEVESGQEEEAETSSFLTCSGGLAVALMILSSV